MIKISSKMKINKINLICNKKVKIKVLMIKMIVNKIKINIQLNKVNQTHTIII